METATLRTQALRGKGTPSSDDAALAPLAPDRLRKMDAYWRAANYLSVGQIYSRQPAAPRAAQARARQAAAARPLGDHAGPELHLRPLNRLIKDTT